jgi:hypothetical protein
VHSELTIQFHQIHSDLTKVIFTWHTGKASVENYFTHKYIFTGCFALVHIICLFWGAVPMNRYMMDYFFTLLSK